MAQDPRFGFDDPAAYRADKPGGGWAKSCLIGCLWTLAVLAVVGAIAGFWIARRWREWLSNTGAQVIKQSIEAADLPEAEKAELGVEIDRIADAFSRGRLTAEQVGAITKMIVESPLAVTIAVTVVQSKYFDSSGLSEEEQVEGLATLRRLAHGAIQGQIGPAKRDAVLRHIAEQEANGNWQLRDRVSDEELRGFLAAAQAEADAAQIEDQPTNVDPSDELRRIIDAALAAPANP